MSRKHYALSEVKELNGSRKIAPVVMKNSLEVLTFLRKKKVVRSGQLHTVNVFTSEVIGNPECVWARAYQESE